MKQKRSVRREKFVNDTFPHVATLWRIARWLTIHDSLAEDLVVNTMAHAYVEWSYFVDPIGNKNWLFKVLTREFLGIGKERHKRYNPGQYLSENIRVTADPGATNPRNTASTFEQLKQRLANGSSEESVRGIIVRIRPQPRLILSLLHIGEFSYTDIAYITDLSRNSVRVILARVRKLISQRMLEHLDCLGKNITSQTASIWHSADSIVENTNVLSTRSVSSARRDTTVAALAELENERAVDFYQSEE